jgi:hypothetical protein
MSETNQGLEEAQHDDAEAIAEGVTDQEPPAPVEEPKQAEELAEGGEAEPVNTVAPLVAEKSVADVSRLYVDVTDAEVDDEILTRYQQRVGEMLDTAFKGFSDSVRLPHIDKTTLALAIEALTQAKQLYMHALRDADKTARHSRKAVR